MSGKSRAIFWALMRAIYLHSTGTQLSLVNFRSLKYASFRSLATSGYQGGFGGNLRPGVEAYGFTTNDYIPLSQPSVPHISGNYALQDKPRRTTSTTGTPGKDLCNCDLGCELEYPASKTQHHLNKYHGDLKREGTQIICPVHREKITEDNFARHIREVHHQREEVRCPHCEKVFSRKGNLKRHLKTH